MFGLAVAAAVIVGAVGGVVAPLNVPPSKTPPGPLQLTVPPVDVQPPGVFAPPLAQSNDEPSSPSNPMFAGLSSSRNAVTPGLFTLAVPTATSPSTRTRARAVLNNGL